MFDFVFQNVEFKM